ncbi:MAG: hypothetical protein IT313_05320 [Anaerolineales bacterium]|nr:hypothetical protein [Anaerolineales bacterium]
MKKFIPLAVAALIVACLPTSPIPGFATPTSAIQATATPIQPSETPLPTDTPVLPTSTATSTVSAPPAEFTTTASPIVVDASATPGTIATSTGAPADNTATSTPAPSQPTLTPTLGILKHGTLPPAVAYNTITLLNRSKVQAYISLQVTTVEGYYTIIEYPVVGKVKIKVPLGSYVYVAWVGGNKMTGSFRLSSADDLVITLFKDKVTVK